MIYCFLCHAVLMRTWHADCNYALVVANDHVSTNSSKNCIGSNVRQAGKDETFKFKHNKNLHTHKKTKMYKANS